MFAVACASLLLGILMACLRWVRYPHINVTIFNETSTTICDLHLSSMYCERTAQRVKPGGVAITEIQSGGDGCIYFTYRDPTGILKKAEPVCYEAGNRGFLEVHVLNEGTRLVKDIYEGLDVGVWDIRARPTGPMTVR